MSVKNTVVFDIIGANSKVDFSAVQHRITSATADGLTWGASKLSTHCEEKMIEKLTQTAVIENAKINADAVIAIIMKQKKDVEKVEIVSNEPYVEVAAAAKEEAAKTGKAAVVIELFGLYDGVDFEAISKQILATPIDGAVYGENKIVDIMDGQKLVVNVEVDYSKTDAAAIKKTYAVFADDVDPVDGVVIVSETPVVEAKSGSTAVVIELFGLYDGVDFEAISKQILATPIDGAVYGETKIVDIMDGQKLVVNVTVENAKTDAAAVKKTYAVFADDVDPVDGVVIVSETAL